MISKLEDNIINVLILHYKTIDKTIDCVSSVLETESGANVCIIDNYSNDGTLEALKSKYSDDKRISFVCLNENKGFARANNAGMRFLYGKGEKYAVVANNDIVFKSNSIRGLIESLNNTGSILSVPKVVNADGLIMDSVQAYRNHNIYEYIYHKMKERFFAPKKCFAEECNDITRIKTFSGCCFACDLEKMNIIDYFDEHTFLYFEEPILSLKIEKAEYDMVFVPKSDVIHYHGATTKGISLFAEACKLESQIYYLHKYLKCNRFLLACYVYLKRKTDKHKLQSEVLYKHETKILTNLIKYIRKNIVKVNLLHIFLNSLLMFLLSIYYF